MKASHTLCRVHEHSSAMALPHRLCVLALDSAPHLALCRQKMLSVLEETVNNKNIIMVSKFLNNLEILKLSNPSVRILNKLFLRLVCLSQQLVFTVSYTHLDVYKRQDYNTLE